MEKTQIKRATTIILIFVILFVGGLLTLRFLRERGENAWVCKNGQWVKEGEPKEPMPEGPCEEGERVSDEEAEVEEPFDQAKFERSKQIAQEAAKNAPTYKFDGFDLKYESSETLRCPNCWEFTFSFSSRYSGYGDRSGQRLAQMITPHKIRVTVENEKVVIVVTDRTFDELNQKFLK